MKGLGGGTQVSRDWDRFVETEAYMFHKMDQ